MGVQEQDLQLPASVVSEIIPFCIFLLTLPKMHIPTGTIQVDTSSHMPIMAVSTERGRYSPKKIGALQSEKGC